MLAVESRTRNADSHSPLEIVHESGMDRSPVEDNPLHLPTRSARQSSPGSGPTRNNELRRSPTPSTGRNTYHNNISNNNNGNNNVNSTINNNTSNNNNSSSSNAAGMYSIVVAVRKRPKIAGREEDENDIVRCETKTTLAVYEPRTKLDLTPIVEPSVFSFDTVYDETCTNAQIYHDCCQPLLQNVRDGGGAVVFAFGQTGSGKTYTMLGQNDTPGLYGLAVKALLDMTTRETLTASFFEVYGTKLYDLLNDRAPVKMLQDEYKNIHIVGLTERKVSSISDVDALMTSGQLLRATGTTHANDRSSRSHAVLEIKVKLSETTSNNISNSSNNNNNAASASVVGVSSSASQEPSTEGRITFVDLAGSERASDTAEATLRTRREGAEINKSLLALKECIRAMSMRKRHIPFRGSKLTQILRESFMGNCKTCVIATISPCQSHCEDTINTLRYAYRIKELKGKANGLQLEAPIPCQNCGLPIFMGDRHVCRRFVVQCPHCRVEMDKLEIEAHLIECKEFPLRCPHCNERMLRGELDRHNRRCTRLPVKCNTCGQFIARNAMEKHVETECIGVKRKCRFCNQLITRGQINAHEAKCEMRKVACPFCLQFVRSNKLEAHQSTCVRNPSVHRSVNNNNSNINSNEANSNVHGGSAATSPTSHSVSVSRSVSRNARADWVSNSVIPLNHLDVSRPTRRLSSLSNEEAAVEGIQKALMLQQQQQQQRAINIGENTFEEKMDKESAPKALASLATRTTNITHSAQQSNETSSKISIDIDNNSNNNNSNNNNAAAFSAEQNVQPSHRAHSTHGSVNNDNESECNSPLEAKGTLKYNSDESTPQINRAREARMEIAANDRSTNNSRSNSSNNNTNTNNNNNNNNAARSNSANTRLNNQQKCKRNPSRQAGNRYAKNDIRNSNNGNNINTNLSSTSAEINNQIAGKGINALQNKAGLLNSKNTPESMINNNRSPGLTSNILNGFTTENIEGKHEQQMNNNNNSNNSNHFSSRDKKQNTPRTNVNSNGIATNNNNNNNNDKNSNGVVMTCPYSRYGCVVKVTPLNLQAHLQQALQQHLELVTLYADRVDAQNVELRRAIVLREPTESAASTPGKEEQQRQLAQRSNDAQKGSVSTLPESHR